MRANQPAPVLLVVRLRVAGRATAARHARHRPGARTRGVATSRVGRRSSMATRCTWAACVCGSMAWMRPRATRAASSVTSHGHAVDVRRERLPLDVNAWLVAEGWALAYRRYSDAYVEQESEARRSRRGMWRGEFVSPWEWRQGKRLRPSLREPRIATAPSERHQQPLRQAKKGHLAPTPAQGLEAHPQSVESATVTTRPNAYG